MLITRVMSTYRVSIASIVAFMKRVEGGWRWHAFEPELDASFATSEAHCHSRGTTKRSRTIEVANDTPPDDTTIPPELFLGGAKG